LFLRMRHPILELDQLRLQADQLVEISVTVERLRVSLLVDLGEFERQRRLRQFELVVLVERVLELGLKPLGCTVACPVLLHRRSSGHIAKVVPVARRPANTTSIKRRLTPAGNICMTAAQAASRARQIYFGVPAASSSNARSLSNGGDNAATSSSRVICLRAAAATSVPSGSATTQARNTSSGLA